MNLGKKIESRRKELGFTQKQFAYGICSQAQLSRIEKGLHTPSHEKLIQLLNKLNVTPSLINYYDDLDYHNKLIQKMHSYVSLRKYQSLYRFIYSNNLWDIFIEDEHLQLLYYFEGVYSSQYLNDQLKALNLLFNGLKQTNSSLNVKKGLYLNEKKEFSESELIILGAIGSCYFMLENHTLAEKYLDFAVKKYLKFENRKNFENIAILLYSSAKNYKYLNMLDKAQNNCQKGLDILAKNHSTFRLAELNYELGEVFRLKKNFFNAELHYITAITAANISDNKIILKHIILDVEKHKKMKLLQKLINHINIESYHD